MTKILGIFSTVLLSGLLFSISLDAADKVPDAIGIWLFDDENDFGKDSSGNGQDGEVQGGAESVDDKRRMVRG
jgi:hypothetical protein